MEHSGSTATAVRVRRMDAQDRAVWGDLWRAYLAFYETELPENVFDTTFARLLEDGGDGPHGLIAVLGGTPVGLVHYIFHAHCWRPEGVCYLQDLYTAPGARGHGVGRALIAAVYEAADSAGKPAVYWLTQDHNHTARALYDKVAVRTPFIKYGRELT